MIFRKYYAVERNKKNFEKSISYNSNKNCIVIVYLYLVIPRYLILI
jgi:hypothetical protein